MRYKRGLLFVVLALLVTTLVFSLKRGYFSPFPSPQPTTSDNSSTIESPKSNLPTIAIEHLRTLNIDAATPVTEETLSSGSNYKRYIASYQSAGNKIFGLLTIPTTAMPAGGFPAIVFNHGYIPPDQYKTTEKYVAYVDYLARNGFVVFKIDLRGHGESEGTPTGSYFSAGYTIDAISALKSLQKLDSVNPQRIGMWGHSMAGNLVLRASLVEPDIKAVVIWAGAVYSYEDFAKYQLSDGSYVRRATPSPRAANNELSEEFQTKVTELRESGNQVDFTDEFWSGVSLTQNLQYLQAPVQLHHASNDSVVNIGYSRDLADALKTKNKKHEFFEYQGGGHNIDSPYFEQAMQKTTEFFTKNL